MELSFREYIATSRRRDIEDFVMSSATDSPVAVAIEVYSRFGDDQLVESVMESWLGDKWQAVKGAAKKVLGGVYDAAKGFMSGTSDFAKSAAQGAQEGWSAARSEDQIKRVQAIADQIADASKAFSQKFKIDPITAAVIIGAGATGGMGGIAMTALAVGLRRGSSWLASKGMDAMWQKVTGYTPEQLDQMWRSGGSQEEAPQQAQPQTAPKQPTIAPAVAAKPGAKGVDLSPQVAYTTGPYGSPVSGKAESALSFQSFLESRDPYMLLMIEQEKQGLLGRIKGWFTNMLGAGADAVKDYAKDVDERGFAKATGERVGRAAGGAAGQAANIGQVAVKSVWGAIKNGAKFLANNPVKGSTMILGSIVGGMIGSYGAKAINDFINKPSADQIQQAAEAAQKAGAPASDIDDMKKVGLSADELAAQHAGERTRDVLGRAKNWQPDVADRSGGLLDLRDRYGNPAGGLYSPDGKQWLGPTAADFIPKDPNYTGLYSATPKLSDIEGVTKPHFDAGVFDGKSWKGGGYYIPSHRGGR